MPRPCGNIVECHQCVPGRAGHEFPGGPCKTCSKPLIHNADFTACEACPFGETASLWEDVANRTGINRFLSGNGTDSQGFCVCARGYYNDSFLGSVECHGEAAKEQEMVTDMSTECKPCGRCIGGSDCEYSDTSGTVALSQGWVQVNFDEATQTGVVLVACNANDPSSPIPNVECHGKQNLDHTRQQRCADNFAGYFCESCELGYFRQGAECVVCKPASAIEGPVMATGVIIALFVTVHLSKKLNRKLSPEAKEALKAVIGSMWQPCRIMITYHFPCRGIAFLKWLVGLVSKLDP